MKKIKKFTKPLQDLDNKLKELKIKFDKKFNLTDFSIFMDKFNTSVYLLKNSTKETSFSKYYERLLELLSDLKQDYNKKNLHRWPIFIMLISAILCLSFSTQYHILGVISKKINSFSSRFDYGGISLLIAGSCYPPYYYFSIVIIFFKSIYLCFITIFALCVFFL